MKKILLVLSLVMAVAFGANAQDGFFRGDNSMQRTGTPGVDEPLVPHGPVGGILDQEAAPLGSGLLVLTALGAVYLVRKKR